MGGRRGVERSAEGERARALGPVSTEETDSHTVFVRSLPFSLTDSQLEDIFSEVGPVRHCFTIKEKGSDQHRGFGFVQFAVTEDAQRAVEEKNGALLQGRKIKVEIAKRRAPLDQRRPPKPDTPNAESTISEQHKTSNLGSADAEPKKRKSSELQSTSPVKKNDAGQRESKKIKADGQGGAKVQEMEGKKGGVVPVPTGPNEKKEIKQGNGKAGVKSQVDVKDGETKEQEQARGSSKQRPARTVVVGGLLNTEMFEAVLIVAKAVGPVESVQRTFSEYELNSRGLAKDGCKPRAAAIVFVSVKAAMQAVAALHTKSIGGGVVWARQLGGEGSKLKKWRLIVRNLPFQITETQLRELFSPSGFSWEITIPRKPDGMSKGFAFVGFTNKSDADKAIKAVNGKSVGKRPIAVDWAVGKKEYETSVSTVTTPAPAVAPSDLEDSDTTASNESEDEAEDSEDDSEVPIGEKQSEGSKSTKSRALGEDADKQTHLVVKMLKKNKAAQEAAVEEEDNEEIKDTEKKTKRSQISTEEEDSQKSSAEEMAKHAHVENMEASEEMDMVKRILIKVVLSTQNQTYPSNMNDDDEEEAEELLSSKPERAKKEVTQTKDVNGKMSRSKKSEEPVVSEKDEKDGDEKAISRTVFIRNLPTDAKVPELRKLFSDFGVVKSFRMVLNPITLRPKGTAFLEYATKEAAVSAITAASTDGEAMNGLMIRGRQISVASAVERDTARDIAKDASKKQEQEDRRNLALAKEGYIQEGTPAAEGVSKKDLERRKMLEREKSTKLRSPNFHVSRTRLSLHNVPKGITEKALKKLFLEAVKSRASKQHPVIKQVKILRDEVTGKARGTAFVEFTEHQHALVALRALNNNPATFTAESRPIVEFAVENSLILRKRAVQLEKHKRFQAVKNGEKVAVADEKQKLVGKSGEGKKSRGDESKRIDGQLADREEARTRSGGSKKKRKKGESTKVETGSVLEQQPSSTTGRKTRREKQDVGSTQARRGGRSKKEDKEGAEEAGQGGPKKFMNGQRDMKSVDRNRSGSNVATQPVANKQERNEKGGLAKQLAGNKRGDVDDSSTRENKRRKKLSRVEAAEDRLDQLVSEYRTKYFSVGPTSKSSKSNTKDSAAAAGDLRRWFD